MPCFVRNFILLALIFFSQLVSAQADYKSVYATASEQLKAKDYVKAEASFKQALDLASKTYGTSSIEYRDIRWWMFFVYDATANIPEAVAELKDAARASTVVRDKFEVNVIEDAERYADKLKNDKQYDAAVSLYRLAARTREQRNWMGDASYYKDLKGILDSHYALKKLDSLPHEFEKIAKVIPVGTRDLATHLYSVVRVHTKHFSDIAMILVYMVVREDTNQGGGSDSFNQISHLLNQISHLINQVSFLLNQISFLMNQVSGDLKRGGWLSIAKPVCKCRETAWLVRANLAVVVVHF